MSVYYFIFCCLNLNLNANIIYTYIIFKKCVVMPYKIVLLTSSPDLICCYIV